MNTPRIAIATALAAALALPVAAAQAQGNIEKCYGVAKAGKNDCQTAKSSCAGTSKKDQQTDAWISVPEGHLREDRRRQGDRRLTPWTRSPASACARRISRDVERERPATGFLEIHAENHLGVVAGAAGGRGLRADYDFSVHAVGLSLGSADGLDAAHLARIAALVKRLQPALVSDHLSWSVTGGRYLNDLLPLPYTEEALAVVVRNVGRLQERWAGGSRSRTRRATWASSQSRSPSPIPRRAGAAQRLRPAARRQQRPRHGHNLRLDPPTGSAACRARRSRVPSRRACGERRRRRADPDRRSRLARRARRVVAVRATVRRFGARPTLIEWDTDIPPLPILLDEAERAARILVSFSSPPWGTPKGEEHEHGGGN